MTDDPLPDEDDHLQEMRDADYISFMAENARVAHESAQNHAQQQVRLEVAKAMIPKMMAPQLVDLRDTLDWWVDWITGELPD